MTNHLPVADNTYVCMNIQAVWIFKNTMMVKIGNEVVCLLWVTQVYVQIVMVMLVNATNSYKWWRWKYLTTNIFFGIVSVDCSEKNRGFLNTRKALKVCPFWVLGLRHVILALRRQKNKWRPQIKPSMG